MRHAFRILRRKNKDGKIYFQARFLDDDGKILKSKSYPEAKTRAAACRLAEADAKGGILPTSSNPSALEYLQNFWSDDSPYFKSRALKGKPLSESYRLSSRYTLKHFENYLKGKKLGDLRPESLDDYADGLAEKGVNPRTINSGLDAIKRPFSLFCKKYHLANNLLEVEKHELRPKERGILTPEELSKVIHLEIDPRGRLAILLGALCGMRRGEVRALQFQDVDFSRKTISIVRNFVFTTEGLKRPKCGSSRVVPAPDPVLEAMMECREVYGETLFLVPNFADLKKPACEVTFKRAFVRILDAIGIDASERKRRNLVFHGLRHTFVSLSQSAGLPDFIVARLAGHKSLSMTERYTHSEGLVDFAQARQAMESTLKAGAV